MRVCEESTGTYIACIAGANGETSYTTSKHLYLMCKQVEEINTNTNFMPDESCSESSAYETS